MPAEYLNCEYKLYGEGSAIFEFDERQFNGQPLLSEDKLKELNSLHLDALDGEYGLALFNAVFPSGSRLAQGYRQALALARDAGKHLRFRLCLITPQPEMQNLHWEMLCDPEDQNALGCALDQAFSRYINLGVKPPAPAATKPRILVVIANPADLDTKFRLPKLDRQSLMTQMKSTLDQMAGKFDAVFLEPPITISRIRALLAYGEFHALHIIAHGTRNQEQRAALILEDIEGNAELVDESMFGNIVQGVGTLRLVTLIACHGGAQLHNDAFGGLSMALVKRFVPAVVAMREAVSVDAAQIFTQHFYQHLANTGYVDAAVNEARNQIRLSLPQPSEWWMPTLFMRLPEGRINIPIQSFSGGTRSGVTSDIPWSSIKNYLQVGRVIPVIGPDVTRGIFLSPRDIAQRWADHWGDKLQSQNKTFPFAEARDLPRVSKYVDIVDGADVPHFEMLKLLKENLLTRVLPTRRGQLKDALLSDVVKEVAPNFFQDDDEPHLMLARMKVSTYITTNYDSFMYEALRYCYPNAREQEHRRQYCHWEKETASKYEDHKQYQKLKASENDRLVFHLYGYDEPKKMVLTEDDYFTFLQRIWLNDWRIPHFIRTAISDSVMLFLGYSVTDLDFRVLWKCLMQDHHTSGHDLPNVVVLQISPEDARPQEEALRDFQEKCCKKNDMNLIVYPGTVREFLQELKSL